MKKWYPRYPITKPKDEREVLGVDPAKVTLVSISEWLYTYADLHVRLVWTGHDAASWRHYRGVGHRPASRQAYFSVKATLAIARDDLGEHIQVDGGQSSRKSAYTGSPCSGRAVPPPFNRPVQSSAYGRQLLRRLPMPHPPQSRPQYTSVSPLATSDLSRCEYCAQQRVTILVNAALSVLSLTLLGTGRRFRSTAAPA